jgi:hypothetical protein
MDKAIAFFDINEHWIMDKATHRKILISIVEWIFLDESGSCAA